MNKVKALLITLCVVVALGLGAYKIYDVVKAAENELNLAVKSMLTDMVNHHWSHQVIHKHAEPVFQRWLDETPNQTDERFQVFKNLGAIKAYKGLIQFAKESKDGHTVAKAAALVDFVGGPRIIEFKMLKLDGQWRFYSIKAYYVKR